MRVPVVVAAIGGIVGVVVVLVLLAPGEPARETVPAATTDRVEPARSQDGAREDCATRSEAGFPGAFSRPRNLVVGPLVLIGGRYTDAATVREFGGNKFPLLVTAGHTVTIQLVGRARRIAGLAYGPLPQGEVTLRDAHDSVTFVACRPGRATQRWDPDGPSGSDADGVNVTFWSGFVLVRAPACVPLRILVDSAAAPQHVGMPLGRRCVSSRPD